MLKSCLSPDRITKIKPQSKAGLQTMSKKIGSSRLLETILKAKTDARNSYRESVQFNLTKIRNIIKKRHSTPLDATDLEIDNKNIRCNSLSASHGCKWRGLKFQLIHTLNDEFLKQICEPISRKSSSQNNSIMNSNIVIPIDDNIVKAEKIKELKKMRRDLLSSKKVKNSPFRANSTENMDKKRSSPSFKKLPFGLTVIKQCFDTARATTSPKKLKPPKSTLYTELKRKYMPYTEIAKLIQSRAQYLSPIREKDDIQFCNASALEQILPTVSLSPYIDTKYQRISKTSQTSTGISRATSSRRQRLPTTDSLRAMVEAYAYHEKKKSKLKSIYCTVPTNNYL